MTPLQDMIGGWRARPLNSLAAALLALALSLLIGAALTMLRSAEQEAETLLQNWPSDQCTLLLPPDQDTQLLHEISSRLPPGSWMACELEGRTAWVLGTLPRGFFQGQGSALSHDLIRRGEAAVLLQSSAAESWQPEDLYLFEDRAYRIYGIGQFALPAERLIPRRARDLLPPRPDFIKVSLPASRIQPLLRDLLTQPGLQLVDHQEKQQQARSGFMKLRRKLSGIILAAALLAALLQQALSQAEIRERKSEFALRRSLGARPKDLRNQIVLEVLLLSALPGLLGLIPFAFRLPLRTLVSAYALTIGWILLCAMLPALQAARLRPGEALKGE